MNLFFITQRICNKNLRMIGTHFRWNCIVFYAMWIRFLCISQMKTVKFLWRWVLSISNFLLEILRVIKNRFIYQEFRRKLLLILLNSWRRQKSRLIKKFSRNLDTTFLSSFVNNFPLYVFEIRKKCNKQPTPNKEISKYEWY